LGQYFKIANLDKREYIDSMPKLWELCANNEIRMLGYLLATDDPDGTAVTKWFKDPEEAKERYGKDFEVIKHDGDLGYGEIKHEYFGRWCGDRIAVVGDYCEGATNYQGPSWKEVKEEFKDITQEVAKEFNQMIEEKELMIGETSSIAPDMVFSKGKVHVEPKIRR